MDKKYIGIAMLALFAAPMAFAHGGDNSGRGNALDNRFFMRGDFDHSAMHEWMHGDDDNDSGNALGKLLGKTNTDTQFFTRAPFMHRGWLHPFLWNTTNTTQIVNGVTYNVITNNHNIDNGNYTGTQSFEMWVNADTHKVKSVDYEFHLSQEGV